MTQTNDPVADPQDQTPAAVDEANLQDVDTQEVDTPLVDANLDSEQVDYKNKFSESAKEAIRLTKENEKQTSEALFYKNMSEVALDPTKLHGIAKSNPGMADDLASRLGWGDTYSAAVKAAGGDTPEATQADPKQAAREVYFEQKQAEEQGAIENFEVQFFIDNKIAIGSPKYKAIMQTYSKYKPSTLTDAQELFTMAHKRHVPNVEVEVPAPNGDFGGRGKVKNSEFSESDKEIMKNRGWDAEKMRKFKASPLGA